MNNDVLKDWVEALRSDKYRQGKNFLNVNNEKFCCFGVLCEIGKNKVVVEKKAIGDIINEDDEGNTIRIPLIGYDGYTCDLPNSIAELVGFDRRCRDVQRRLVHMNDDNNNSFSEIADYIEEHLIT